jgi:hypothetical protein
MCRHTGIIASDPRAKNLLEQTDTYRINTMTLAPERHEAQHAALERLQERIDCIYASAYANAKQRNVHAPRQFAERSTRSRRVSQYHAWRTHLHAHGVSVPTFATLDDLKRMHDELHKAAVTEPTS